MKEVCQDEELSEEFTKPCLSDDWGVHTINIGDFVIVRFATKTALVHFIGKVVETNDGDRECKVQFMRRYKPKSDYFVFPLVDDEGFVSYEDIQKLPDPATEKGTERTASKLNFNIIFSKLNVR